MGGSTVFLSAVTFVVHVITKFYATITCHAASSLASFWLSSLTFSSIFIIISDDHSVVLVTWSELVQYIFPFLLSYSMSNAFWIPQISREFLMKVTTLGICFWSVDLPSQLLYKKPFGRNLDKLWTSSFLK